LHNFQDEQFTIESCVRGYHVYKDIWEASVGEQLPCQCENGNRADPFDVVVVKRWAHTTKDIFSLFPLPTQKWCGERLYYRQKALFSGSAPGRPWNSLPDHIWRHGQGCTKGAITCHSFSADYMYLHRWKLHRWCTTQQKKKNRGRQCRGA